MSVQYLDKTGLAYFWGKIKAYISSVLPTKTSDLTNDSGFINSPNIPYLTCATAANVAAKTTTLVSGTLPSTLTTGLQVLVKFTNSNSIANPTLAIGSLTAKSIKRYGTTAPSTSSTTSWQAGSTILFNYDGTYWQMADWTNTNTTYSSMTDAEYQAGTSTSNRLITPARLKAAILYHAPTKTSVTVDAKTTSGTNIADITVDGTTVQLYAPSGGGGAETDPIFSASAAAGISSSDIESWSAKLNGLVVTVGSAVGSYHSLNASYSTIISALTHGEPVVLTDGDVIYPYVGPTAIDNTPVLAFGISATMNNYTLLQGYLVLPNDLAMYVNQTSQIPTAVSQLTNDSGYITGYTETDPTVPAWAKAATKPSYTASEVGAVPTARKVNNKALSSDITLAASDVGALADSVPYISDFGTSNGWTYRKWANKAGTYKVMEMWGEWNNTSKTSTSDGGGYVSVNATTPPDFPIAFAAKPIVNVSIDSGGQIVVPINMTRPTATSAGSWKGYRVSTNNGTANKWFMFHVIGTYS